MKLSREGAIGNLKIFFGNTEFDYVSVENIFKNAARGEYSLESNRKWLYNRLTLIKPYGLHEKVNGVQNGVRVTQGLALTPEGRRALHDEGQAVEAKSKSRNQSAGQVTFRSIRQDIKILRERYPEFEIIFDARLKDDEDV